MEFSIKTDRLILRDPREEDEDTIVHQFTDPTIKYKILPHQADETYQRTFMKAAMAVAKQKPRSYYALTITLHDETTIVGSCTLDNVFQQSYKTRLGWNLGRDYWGKGYAVEATKALLTIGFEINEVNYISAECFAHNRAAIRVLEKSGMKPRNNNYFSEWLRAVGYKVGLPVIKYQIRRKEYFAQIKG